MLRENLFDSKTEERLYLYLHSNLSDKFMIHAHVPVFNVFERKKVRNHPKIGEREFSFLEKTNFDFVVVDKDSSNPILIIEFDGLGMGYNTEKEYVQVKETCDPYRKLKLDCKTILCHSAKMPFVIISYPEVELIENQITVLDGIIGTYLANREFNRLFQEDVHLLEEELKNVYDPIQREVIIEQYGLEREVESKYRYNPILRKIMKLQHKLMLEKKLPISCSKILGDPTPLSKKLGYPDQDDEGYDSCLVIAEYRENKKDPEDPFSTKNILCHRKIPVRTFHCKGVVPWILSADIGELLVLLEIANMFGVSVD
ncbi:DUF2726 domain-containing protein [Polycladomyces sp. WAk]|uniref:DUF2726 domain-containing protein n=1 Tax=Polycladomyces zharkentensis TaxID=2807616 RepID=A0ABS2WMU2_9BACL|nr:DUF2726 domain-containing protein [Polycladomyces sp. WAk]MBN2910761.1 DUF2726 domain-containing protein [Polycladomyces sp. WAk]